MVQQDGGSPKIKRTPVFLVIGTMLVALVGIAIAAWIVWNQIAEDETAAGMAGPKAFRTDLDIGGPFILTNHRGETVTDASYRGRFMLVYFGYTFCPDVCPTELANMATALEHLGKRADRIQPLFITVDPARDTARMLAGYVSHFHPQMQGLTGTPAQIKQVAKAYRVFFARAGAAQSANYLMDHSSFVYLMAPDGRYLTMFRRATDPREMAVTIGRLIADRPTSL